MHLFLHLDIQSSIMDFTCVLLLPFILSVASPQPFQDYIDEMGMRSIAEYNRDHPRPLTCNSLDNGSIGFYTWFVEGGQALEDWLQETSFGQVTYSSTSHNEISIMPSSDSQINSWLIYCMNNNKAIVNMIELQYKGNELLFDKREHIRAPCSLAEGYRTSLSCKGATRQNTGHCSWYSIDPDTEEKKMIIESIGPVLVLGQHVPANEGIYSCKCKIFQAKTTLRLFDVKSGSLDDSFFCKHIPESADTTTATTSDFVETSTVAGDSPQSPFAKTTSSSTTTSKTEDKAILPRRNAELSVTGSTTSVNNDRAEESAVDVITSPIPGIPDSSVFAFEPSVPRASPAAGLEKDPHFSLHSQEPAADTTNDKNTNLTRILVVVIIGLVVTVIVILVVVVTIVRHNRRRYRHKTRHAESLVMMPTNADHCPRDNCLLDIHVPAENDVTTQNGNIYV